MRKSLAWILLLAVAAGCKSQGQSVASHLPGPGESIAATEPASESKFSFRRAMQLVGFGNTPSQDTTPASLMANSLVPNELVRLSATVNDIVARASQLDVNDPAHITAQKAQAIMEALDPWDSVMAAARSLGMVNEATLRPLQILVEQLRIQTVNLLQVGSRPETVAAIQHLAGQLKSSFAGVSALMAEGGAAYNALMGGAPAAQ